MYSLTRIDRDCGLAELVGDGSPLGIAIEGVAIEAEFGLEDGEALVWLTGDCPYEEGLHIYLLNRCGQVGDAVGAGAPFAAGILEIQQAGSDFVQFKFFNNERVYRLEIDKNTEFRVSLPPGWRYKTLLTRHRLGVWSSWRHSQTNPIWRERRRDPPPEDL